MSTELAPKALSPAEITALLRNAGAIEADDGSSGNYIKIEGTTFYLGDDMYVSNPKTGAPAFLAQIAGPLKQLQSRWWTPAEAEAVGRPNIADHMCRSWFDEPDQNREYAEDGTSCRKCPVNPFVNKLNVPDWAEDKKKCQQRGELDLRVFDPETGKVASEDIYTLRMSFTSLVEWHGLKESPEKGHVGPYNFMHLLANLAAQNAAAAKEDPSLHILRAMTSLRLGGVIAEVRAVPKQSQDKSRNYYVTQLTPVQIHDVQEPSALPSGDDSDAGDNAEDGALPF